MLVSFAASIEFHFEFIPTPHCLSPYVRFRVRATLNKPYTLNPKPKAKAETRSIKQQRFAVLFTEVANQALSEPGSALLAEDGGPERVQSWRVWGLGFRGAEGFRVDIRCVWPYLV